MYPHQFVVLDDEAPCFTEPYWNDIGLRVYPRASLNIGVVAIVVGMTVLTLRFEAHTYYIKT